MTREDRAHEIEDYVRYLDQLCATVFSSVRRESVSVHVLGFSQGTATATRWVTQGQTRPDRLIAWGAPLPPDIDHESDTQTLRTLKLVLVAGDRDEYITPKVMAAEETRLTRLAIPFRTIRFDGRHTLDPEVLRQLAGEEGRGRREEGRGKREE
jgi:predicted esterase